MKKGMDIEEKKEKKMFSLNLRILENATICL